MQQGRGAGLAETGGDRRLRLDPDRCARDLVARLAASAKAYPGYGLGRGERTYSMMPSIVDENDRFFRWEGRGLPRAGESVRVVVRPFEAEGVMARRTEVELRPEVRKHWHPRYWHWLPRRRRPCSTGHSHSRHKCCRRRRCRSDYRDQAGRCR